MYVTVNVYMYVLGSNLYIFGKIFRKYKEEKFNLQNDMYNTIIGIKKTVKL